MKPYFATIEELNDMDLDEQIKTFNRFIESQNRQIRRMRASHPDLLEEFPGIAQMSRKGLPKITKREAAQYASMKPSQASSMILQRYQGERSKVGEKGVSLATAEERKADRLKMEEAYGFDDMTPEEAEYIRGQEGFIKSASSRYYELMRYGVETGYFSNYDEARDAMGERYDEGKWQYVHRSINAYLRKEGRSEEITIRNKKELMARTMERIMDRDRDLIAGQYNRRPKSRTGGRLATFTRPSPASEKRNRARKKKGLI